MRLVQYAVAAVAVPAEASVGEALAAIGHGGWVVVVGEDARPLGVLSRAELAGVDPAGRVDRVLVTRAVPATLVVESDVEVADLRLPVMLGSLEGELPRVVVWEHTKSAGVLGTEELAAAFGIDPAALARVAKDYNRPTYLRTSEVAGLLHVSPKTVSRWAQEGKLPFLRTLGGHRRYPDSEIRALVEELRMSPVMQEAGPPAGPLLPGPRRIGPIVRQCHFQQPHRGLCGVTREFERKPRVMPACTNPNGLVPHDFTW
jgi:excisionase family DNA binding protein